MIVKTTINDGDDNEDEDVEMEEDINSYQTPKRIYKSSLSKKFKFS